MAADNQGIDRKLKYAQLIVGIAALASGGVGAAVLARWWTRDTTVAYAVTSAPVIDSARAPSTLVLHASIDGESVQTLYAHSLSMWAQSGLRRDEATIALSVSESSRVFFVDTNDDEDPLRDIDCARQSSGTDVVCKIEPINPATSHVFRVTAYTSSESRPAVDLEGENVRLVEAESTQVDSLLASILSVLVASVAGYSILLTARRSEELEAAIALMIGAFPWNRRDP